MGRRNIFLKTTATTNEKYREELNSKIKTLGLCVGSLSCTVASISAIGHDRVGTLGHLMGFIAGACAGLIIFLAFTIFYIRSIMANEDKLRETRIKMSDERANEISKNALSSTAIPFFLIMYISCAIGGIYYPVLMVVAFGSAILFAVIGAYFHWYYNKNM